MSTRCVFGATILTIFHNDKVGLTCDLSRKELNFGQRCHKLAQLGKARTERKTQHIGSMYGTLR